LQIPYPQCIKYIEHEPEEAKCKRRHNAKVNEQTEKAKRNACDEVATNGTVVRSKGDPLGPVLAQL
jgi:ssDNA-binding Zn-finger/Zn-ribbon topoisomerase 1